jgi:ribosomal protein S18 acetylase RimI-like enzyme
MIDFKTATTKEHFKTIAKLAHEIWHEHYIPIIGKDQVNYMVAKFQTSDAMQKQAEEGYEYYLLEDKNNAVGYLAIEKRNETLFLSKIYLLKTCRGKGFGKEAFSFIEKRANDLNCKSISLTVNKNNTNTIKAYKKIGFKNTEAIVMDIGNGFVMDDYRMVKALA